jgi:outer membrane protein OmpA-like peptidoglycan-associated protein
VDDRCPNAPGPAENHGCPILDSDGDGIPDDVDKCRDQPEDKDGFQDEDGCPDPDNDGDGLIDTVDKCPNEPGPPANMGCPVRDRDGDGIPDAQDRCPNQAGPAENEGCPEGDRDGDTVVDRLDKCPDVPGVPEEQGCPRQYKLVVVKKDRIEIKQQIKFATGSHKIIGKESFAILDDIARALSDNAGIKQIRIEGHTDSVGDDAANLKLSQRRADSVLSELLKRHIDRVRLQAVGYGETKPISSNATKLGRAENRRTEFNIVDQ